MAVKTKAPPPTTSTAPRIPAPASQAARTSATRPSTSATSSRLAVSPQAVSTSQQRRNAAQTPAPVPSAQRQKTPITLSPGLNAQEKKDAGLIGRVLDTAPKFAELVANRAASGQLSSKQLNDLAYIAKQGQVHGRTDQQVRASLEKAMKGMLPNAVPAGQNQGLSGRPSSNAATTPSIGRGLGQQLGALLNYDIGDALVQRVDKAGIQWATARGNQELAQFLQDDLARHHHLKDVGLAGAAVEVARALPGEFQNDQGQYSVKSIAAGVDNLSGLGDVKGLLTGTDFKGRPVNPYQGALNIGLGAAAGVVGRSSIGGIGEAATRTLNTLSAKGNQVLDTMAYGLFGGGPGPALAYAGGGVGSAVLNGGRQLGNLSRSLELSGLTAVSFMAKSGPTPVFSNTPHSTGSGGRPALPGDEFEPRVVDQRVTQTRQQYPDAVRAATPQAEPRGTSQRIPPPPDGRLPAFPDAEKAKAKTAVQGGGGLRTRWLDSKGNIYEWDSQHGKVEKYNARGNHLGEFDPQTGEQTKPADPARKTQR